jgi:hypothetical protein
LDEDLRRRRHGRIGRSWYVNETYIKVHGEWRYLYRAVDRDGALLDVMLSERRARVAAKAFYRAGFAIFAAWCHARGLDPLPARRRLLIAAPLLPSSVGTRSQGVPAGPLGTGPADIGVGISEAFADFDQKLGVTHGNVCRSV